MCVRICTTSFSSCIVSSWPLSVLVFPGLMRGANAARDMLARNLKRGWCMLIDVGQFD